MSPSILRLLLLCLALLCAGTPSRAGIANYTDRGKIDFDAALHLLNPYGTWSKIDGVWAYTPLNHQAPYTDGRWLYTEFGWYWKGNNPHSWLTEHYGYWKRSPDKVWSWYPGTYWLSEIIEFRATPTHIGWRSEAVDQDGNFVDPPDDRYAKTDEWTFVTKEQFANPITPGIIAKPDTVLALLLNSTDCNHAYMTYRALDRPGPHPADFVALSKDGGMFSPLQGQEVVASTAPDAPKPVAPKPATNVSITNAAATKAPAPAGTDDDDHVDKRQVKYWVTMSLPTYWTPRPAEAKLEEIYMFRPDFFQDEDGIQRRITVWFNPQAKTSLKEIFAESAGSKASAPNPPATTATPAEPATPASPAKSHDPFGSPLDAPYKPSHSSSSSSKNSTTNSAPAPSGMANPTTAK